jgi:arylsulfatase A-like enzyme
VTHAAARLPRLASLIVGLALCACSPEPPRNLVLISIDTLRADFLGTYGYERETSPTLDALASGGVVFESAMSAAPWTLPSHASLLTGLYPSRHGARGEDTALAAPVRTLAQLFADAGFETAAFVNSYYLSERYGFDRGFASFRYAPEFADKVGSSPIGDRAIGWLGRERREPFFLFLHFYDVHSSYRPLPYYARRLVRPYQGRANGSTRQLLAFRRGLFEIGEEDARHLADLYAAEILQLDDVLARVLQALDADGLRDRTLIVVTSDHGEEFLEHGGVAHGRTQYQELLRVPLILNGPGVANGVRIAEPVSLVDVLPTLAGIFGLAVPPDLDGADLSPLWRGRAPEALVERSLFGEADHNNAQPDLLRAVRRGRFKLVLDRASGETELYDLERDPGETRDASADAPEVASRLRAELDAFLARRPDHTPQALPGLADQERRGLEALGYLEGPEEESSE